MIRYECPLHKEEKAREIVERNCRDYEKKLENVKYTKADGNNIILYRYDR